VNVEPISPLDRVRLQLITQQQPPTSTEEPTLEDLEQLLAGMKTAGDRQAYLDALWEELLTKARQLNSNAPMDFNLFAIIQGNQILNDSPLEGISPTKTASYLKKILEQLAPAHPMYGAISSCYDLQMRMAETRGRPAQQLKLAKEISAKIAQLGEEDFLLIPGGMQGGAPGHFMLYEIRKSSFVIYNTGKGLDEFHPKVIIEERYYYYPVFEIKEISPLNLKSIALWRILIELTIRENDVPYKSIEDLYAFIQLMLRGKHCEPILTVEQRDLLILGQASGVCSWQAFLAFLKLGCGRGVAKQLIFQIKFWSLAQFFVTLKERPTFSMQRVIVRAIASIAKRMEAICIDSNDYILAYTLIKHITQWLQGHQVNLAVKQTPVALTTQRVEREALTFTNDAELAERLFNSSTEKKPRRMAKAKVDFYQVPDLTHPEALCLAIKQWADILESKALHNLYAALSKMRTSLFQLPVPSEDSPFWNRLAETDLNSLFSEINRLACLFIAIMEASNKEESNNYGYVENRHYEMRMHLYHFYAMLDWAFIRLMDQQGVSVRQYGIALPRAWLLFKTQLDREPPHPYAWAIPDFRQQERLNQLEQYFINRNAEKDLKLFCYPEAEKWGFEITQDSQESIADFDLIHQLLERTPHLVEKLRKAGVAANRVSLMAHLFIQKGPGPTCPIPSIYFAMREFYYTLQLAIHGGKTGWKIKEKLKKEDYSLSTSYGYNFHFEVKDPSENVVTVTSDAWRVPPWSNPNKSIEKFFEHMAIQEFPLKESHELMTALFGGFNQNEGLYHLASDDPPERLEKSLLAHLKKLKPLAAITQEELSRWIDIRSTRQNRLLLCLRYYLDNILLLDHAYHRQFLSFNLLEQDQLQKAVKANPMVLQMVKELFQKMALVYFRDPVKIAVTLDCLELGFSLETFKRGEFLPFEEAKNTLQYLHEQFKNDPQNLLRGTIDFRLIQWYSLQGELKAEELYFLLRAWVQLASSNHIDSYLKARHFFSSQESKIRACLLRAIDRDNVLNALVHYFEPAASLETNWKGPYPCFKNGIYEINLATGHLLHNQQQVTALSWRIQNSHLITTLFNITSADYFICKDNVYHNEEKGLRITVGRPGDYDLLQRLEKRIGEEWVTYSDMTYNPAQMNNVYRWILRRDKLTTILFQNKLGETLYRVVFQHTPEAVDLVTRKRKSAKTIEVHSNFTSFQVKREADDHLLVSFDSSSLPENLSFAKHFLKIEGPRWVLLWADPVSLEITSVELIRLQKSFHVINGEYCCDQLNGMRLLTEGYQKPFVNFDHYLVLESNGKTFALVPKGMQLKTSKSENKEEPLHHSVKAEFSKELENGTYLFEIDEGRGICLADNLEAQIYLARLYGCDANYAAASRCLKGCWKDRLYTKTEAELLASYPDLPTPEGHALSSYAQWLLCTNFSEFNSTPYTHYLNAHPYLPQEMRLTKAQELEFHKCKYSRLSEDEQLRLKQRELVLTQKPTQFKQVVKKERPPYYPTEPHEKTSIERDNGNRLNFSMQLYLLSFSAKNKEDYVYFESKNLDQFVDAFVSEDFERSNWFYAILLINRNKFLRCNHDALMMLSHYPQPMREILKTKGITEINISNVWELLREYYQKVSPKALEVFKSLNLQFNANPSPLMPRTTLSPSTLPLLPRMIVSGKKKEQKAEMVCEVPLLSLSALFNAYFIPVEEPPSSPMPTLRLKRRFPLLEMIEQSPKAYELYSQYFDGTAMTHKRELFRVGDFGELEGLKQRLIERIQELNQITQILEKELVDRVNATPLDQDGTLTIAQLQSMLWHEVKVLNQKKERINLEQMVMCFVQRDPLFEGLKTPFLKPEVLSDLKFGLIHYLLLKCEMQQIERALHPLHQLLASGEEAILIQKVQEALTLDRGYDPYQEPHLLAFEYLNQIQYRKKQVELLKTALDPAVKRSLFQVPMGQGKTVVLLPSFAFMLADGTKPVFLVVAAAHLEQVYLDLSQFCRIYGKRIYRFHFDRSSALSPSILNEFTESKEEKGLILTTRESLQALLLKGCECITGLTRGGSLNAYAPALNLIMQLIEMLQTSVMVGDEIHHLLKSLFELNFTIGKGIPLTSDRWNVSIMIYRNLLKAGFDFSHPFNIRLSQEDRQRWEEMKEFVIQQLVQFCPMGDDEACTKLENYLKGKSEDVTWLRELHQESPTLATQIVVAHEQLEQFVPHALGKEWNVNFGRSKKNRSLYYAIPYEGKDNPTEGSEFGHYFIMINLTIQMYLKTGLDEIQFKEWVSNLKAERAKEKSLGLKGGEESRVQRILREVFRGDPSIFELNLNDAKIFAKVFQEFFKHPYLIMDFLDVLVFPTVKVHKERLHSNALQVTDFLFKDAKVIGLSGTLYNKETLSKNFHEHTYIDEEGMQAIIAAMRRPVNQRVTSLNGRTSEEILEEIAFCVSNERSLQAIIDNGALFKGMSNLEAAKALQAKLQYLKGVLLFDDEKQNAVMLKKGKKSAEMWNPHEIKEGGRLTLYDQLHAFGANIPHSAFAGAVTTVDSFSAFFQILQAVMRMRQAEQGQYVRYFLLNYLADALKELCEKQELTGDEILLMGILIEAEMVELELIAATQHEIKQVFGIPLLESAFRFSKDRTLNFLEITTPAFRQAWNQIIVEEIVDDPFHQFLEPMRKENPRVLFESLARTCREGLTLFDQSSALIQSQLKKIIDYACQRLPPLIPARALQSLQQEVQKQEEKALEKRLNTEGQKKPEPALEKLWKPEDLIKTLNARLTGGQKPDFGATIYVGLAEPVNVRSYKVEEWMEVLKFPSLFGPEILLSHNFLTSASNLPYDFSMKFRPVDFFLEFRPSREMYHLHSTFLVLSLQEAELFQEHCSQLDLDRIDIPYQLNLRDISGTLLGTYHNWEEVYLDGEIRDKQLQRALVQLAFLDGREFYPPDLIEPLQEWMQEVADKNLLDKLEELLQKIHENRSPTKEFGKGNFFTLLASSH